MKISDHTESWVAQEFKGFSPPFRLSVLDWAKRYNRANAVADLMAAVIVTLMLVPQALAYATLAGLPARTGLYASMLPLVIYAVFGSSRTLAVGPVAIAALMTASAISPFAALSPALGIQAALVLAVMVGAILFVAGLLRLGFLAGFLSHPVISGFISAASILIATNQFFALCGLPSSHGGLYLLISNLLAQLPAMHGTTFLLSVVTLIILWLSRQYGVLCLKTLGLPNAAAQAVVRAVPAALVIIGVGVMQYGVDAFAGVKTVGHIPQGLPAFSFPIAPLTMWEQLLMPAVLVAMIGFIESISVAQKLSGTDRSKVDPDQELVALGLANVSAGVSAGLPVAGGVSRSAVNMDAGAQTQAAGLFTAVGMILVTYFVAESLAYLPQFVLSATIIVAVLSLFDWRVFKQSWGVSKHDFYALVTTFLITLFVSVEWGIAAGVLLSISLHLYKTSRPHIAVVGQVPGTEHFRNIDRHDVIVSPAVVTLRVDESLYFANANYLDAFVQSIVTSKPTLKHLILMCSAVNVIDESAMLVLEAINTRLSRGGIGFHLSEVKGPVMDELAQSELLARLNGNVYLTQYMAYQDLTCDESPKA